MDPIIFLCGVALYLFLVICLCAVFGFASPASLGPNATDSLDLHGGMKTRSTDF
jgi:hypothetical protein